MLHLKLTHVRSSELVKKTVAPAVGHIIRKKKPGLTSVNTPPEIAGHLCNDPSSNIEPPPYESFLRAFHISS
jgi:hypothetical protein